MDKFPADDDELFAPALAGVVDELPEEGDRPWHLGSQLYVGFFGGPLAAAAIAWLNAERLGVTQKGRLAIAAAGVAGLAAAVVAAVLVGGDSIRLFLAPTGLATAAVARPVQSKADRRYAFRHAKYDSLWGPGLAAVIGLGLLQALFLYVVRS
jgi:hypothetical protein